MDLYTGPMSRPRPPPSRPPPPGESPWAAAARELASNPESPQSLRIRSAFNAALAPREKAIQQLVDALEVQLESATPNPAQEAAVTAAIAHWQKACGAQMEPALLEDLRALAARQAMQKRNSPPPMNAILSTMPAATDVGYQLGIHLQGLGGTWHRLWGILSIACQLGDDPDVDAGCQEVRQQFEQVLGRQIQQQEWSALLDSARAHANRRTSAGEGQ